MLLGLEQLAPGQLVSVAEIGVLLDDDVAIADLPQGAEAQVTDGSVGDSKAHGAPDIGDTVTVTASPAWRVLHCEETWAAYNHGQLLNSE